MTLRGLTFLPNTREALIRSENVLFFMFGSLKLAILFTFKLAYFRVWLQSLNLSMDLQESFTLKGIFNPADEPDNQLTGELTFSQQKGTDVTLLGTFDRKNAAGSKLGLYHGFSTNGKKMTLVDNSVSLESFSMPGIAQSGIHSRYLFIGDWHNSSESLIFDAFRFTCKDLNYWLHISGFEKPVYNNDDHEVVIRYKKPGTKLFPINDDFNLYIEFDYYGPPEWFVPSEKITVEQKPYLKIMSRKGKQHFEKFMKCYFSLLSFLSFCYFGYPVTTECVFQREGVDADSKPLKDIELFYWASMNFEKYIEHRDRQCFLIRLIDIMEIFPTILQNWLPLKDKIKVGINMLTELFMYRNSPIELRFLSMAQAAEHMHRQLINDQDKIILRQRLEELIAHIPIDVKDALLSDPAKFIAAIKENRNFFTHYNEKQANKAARLEEVYLLSEKMKIILLTVVFKELGIPNNDISNIILNNGIWLFNHLIKIKSEEKFNGA